MHERFLGKVTGEAFLGLERVDLKSQENLNQAKDHLRKGSVIAYFDHFARFDMVVYGKIIKENLTSLDNVASWVAIRYLDPSKNPVISGLLKAWTNTYGLTLFPIVQGKDKDKYPNPNSTNMKSFNQAVEFLQKPGRVLVVAPEGTRSNTGALLKAEPGFGSLLKRSPDSLVLPLAGVHSRALPVLSKTTVIIGDPFTYQEMLDEQQANPERNIADLAMLRLASLLPEQNRGYYK